MSIARRLLVLFLLALTSAFSQDRSQSVAEDDSFQWKQAIAESFFEIATANLERIATQPDTRNDIRGPFWKNYVDSVENLHGFNDGDGFFTSYVLHSMEGSFAGFIERQNDPKYRDVEFGMSQRYWISCMRSLAFSTAFSTAWSGSPFGEPGVGNVELHNKPGLVDLIGTQTLGLGWMIGEDALDRFVIKRIERHVRNPYVRGMVRSFLNPTRGYANIMALRQPWHRDSRPGIYAYTPGPTDTPPDDLNGPKFRARAWPEHTAFALEADPVVERYLGPKGSTCAGSGGQGDVQLSALDLAFRIDGCELHGLRKNVTGDALNYVLGPRWHLYSQKRWVPVAQLLVGGAKITHVTTYPDRKRQLFEEAEKNHKPPPEYADYNSETDTNGFTLLASAGVLYRINDGLSWQVGELGYQRSWSLDQLQGFAYNRGLRLTTGLTLTMGPWRH